MLTETAIKHAKPKAAPYKLSDERGLVMLVQPTGAKWWRFRYRLWGKEKGFSLGIYPDVSLAKARERRDDARRLVADGVDPLDVRRDERNAHKDTFSVVAKEWSEQKVWAQITRTKNERVIRYLNKEIGNRDARTAVRAGTQRFPDLHRVIFRLPWALLAHGDRRKR